MRRKSERNKSKSSEKKLDTPARKSRRTSRRRKRSTSHTSSDDSDDAPLVKPVVVETPAAEIALPLDEPKKSTSNSDEEKQEQPIWKVKTSESPSGEIQKLKICLQRPSTTPERTEKSPRRRRAKASSQSDDAYLTPDEKPQQLQGRRKLRRGSPPPGEPAAKDDGDRKVIKDDNDEASAGKGKLECSQRRQDTENAECVQDSEVKKSLGSSELSNDIPQEEDIKSTTSKDEQEIIVAKVTTKRKDTKVVTSPPIKTQDTAIEPITTQDSAIEPNTAQDSVIEPNASQAAAIEPIKTQDSVIEPIKTQDTECMEIETITTQKSEQTESKDSIQLEASVKSESATIAIESSPNNKSTKCKVESSPKVCNDQSSPVSDCKKDETGSLIKSQTSDTSIAIKVESSPTKDSTDVEASPIKSESSSNKSEEQTSEVSTLKKTVDSKKSSKKSSPVKESQPSHGSEETLVKPTVLLKIELQSPVKVPEDSQRPETTNKVGKEDKKKEKCEIKHIETVTITKDEDIEIKSPKEQRKTSAIVLVVEDTVKSEVISETIVIDVSDKTDGDIMNKATERVNKEDMEKISETIKRDLNRNSERISERKVYERDDSDKSEPEEKIVISEDEETKTEKSATPTPETQQIIRPLHRRKWGKYPAKLQNDIRVTLETFTAMYPQMKLIAEEDLKLEIVEHKEVIRPVRKEREVVVMPHISPKEEDTEKEVSNIGLNRKISIVNDEASKLQPPPSPPKHPVSAILYITNLVRPFTLKQLKELLSRTGKILDDGFWTDRIKSRCYVQYETEEEAEATRNALHGVQWPIGNGKKLMIDFGLLEAMEAARTAVEVPVASVKVVPEKIVEKLPELDKKEQQPKEDDRWDKKRAAAPTREWDLGKVPQDLRDRSRSRDRPKSRSDRSSDKRRHPENESPSNGDHLSPRKKKKEEQAEVKLMDDLFRKTKATPSIYWLPLTPDQIAKKQQQRLQRMAEHKRRMEESTRRVPLRDFGRGAPRSRRRSDRFNAD